MKLFIDTNLPLHHQPLDQINWKEVTESDDVTLVFSVVVLDELDQHTRNPRLASRAKRARKELYGFIETGIVKGNVKAESILKPHTKILDEYNLDPAQNDQWILGSIKAYMKKNAHENVALLTADVGMRIRARAYGIPAIMLDEKYKLEEETDEQKENKKLKAEIEKYKSATPQLSITFEKGKAISFELEFPNYEQHVRGKLSNMLYKDYPKISHSIDQSERSRNVATYNSQLDEYYIAYQKYLDDRKDLYFAETLTVELDLLLKNSGAVHGKSIDIELFFPSGLTVSEKPPNKRFPEPNRKNPPTFGVLKQLTWTHETNYVPYPKAEPESFLKVHKISNGATTIELHVANLKQQKDFSIPVIYVTFESYAEVKGFNIEYSIRAENAPDVVKGTLNVNASVKLDEQNTV